MKITKYLIALIVLTSSAFTHAKTLNVGILMDNFDNNYQAILRTAMTNEIKSLGDVQVQIQDAKGDTSMQLQQAENFVNQGVDGLIVIATDTQAVKPIITLAGNSKTPLVFVTRKPEAPLGDRMAFVGSDSQLAGKMQMQALAEKMNGKGNIMILMGSLSAEETRERTKSIEAVVAEHPGIKILDKQAANFARQDALNVTTNWMLSGQHIDAIAANNDEMAIGAIMAIKQTGQKDVLVAGIDGTPDALQFINSGDLALTIFQDAKTQGVDAVKTLADIINGKKVSKDVLVPYQLITKANLKEFIQSQKK